MRLRSCVRLTVLVLAIVAMLPGAALGVSQTVVIRNSSFVLANTTIAPGESITWQNTDPVAHTATSDTGAFDTLLIAPGATSKTVLFANAGTYAYHCSIHLLMKGTITVQGAPPTPTPVPPPPTPRPTPPPTPPPTEAPTASPSEPPSPSPTPSASASPAPTPLPTPPPSRLSLASPSATAAPSAGSGPALGGGPGQLLAAVIVALAAGLAAVAIYLYRRR